MNVRFSRLLLAGAALALVAFAPTSARAQAQKNGFRLGVEADLADHHQGFGVGAFGKFHLAEISERAVTGRVNFDYYFPSNSYYGSTKIWTIEGSGIIDIVAKGETKPYLGAGLTYENWSYSSSYCGGAFACPSASSTDLHVLGGVNFMGNSKLMPFAEAKLILSGGSSLVLRGGIHF
jgi:hypothetical protein